MHTILQIFEIVVSILLVACIMLQTRNSGLSSTFGGNAMPISTTKRGPEKVVFNATIVLAVLFVLSSMAFVFVR